MKKTLALLVTSFCLLFLASPTFALTIDTIGTTSVPNGNPGTDWYYTSENPSLSGTAAANSSVTVTIDGTAYPVTVNSTSNWSYVPTTLTNGDRAVVVTGDSQTLSFTLHVGQNVPTSSTSTSTSSGQTLPVSGALENTLMLLGGGAILIVAGWKLSTAINR